MHVLDQGVLSRRLAKSKIATPDAPDGSWSAFVNDTETRVLHFERKKVSHFWQGDRMAKNRSVFGVYATRDAADFALTGLRDARFSGSDVSILLPENLGPRELVVAKETKAPEGTATGAGSGAVIGGALGWLVGIGALAIPGLGPFIAAGPIMAALAGIGAGGVVGGLVGGLVGLGIPEYEAKRYEGRLRRGGILLSVHCDTSDKVKLAKDVMERSGAEDVSTTVEASAGLAAGDRRSKPAGTRY
jgi:hypothetical protein